MYQKQERQEPILEPTGVRLKIGDNVLDVRISDSDTEGVVDVLVQVHKLEVVHPPQSLAPAKQKKLVLWLGDRDGYYDVGMWEDNEIYTLCTCPQSQSEREHNA